MSIQLRKLHLLIQNFMILQLRHAAFITQSLKEIHSGRETGLIDTGPLILKCPRPAGLIFFHQFWIMLREGTSETLTFFTSFQHFKK